MLNKKDILIRAREDGLNIYLCSETKLFYGVKDSVASRKYTDPSTVAKYFPKAKRTDLNKSVAVITIPQGYGSQSRSRRNTITGIDMQKPMRPRFITKENTSVNGIVVFVDDIPEKELQEFLSKESIFCIAYEKAKSDMEDLYKEWNNYIRKTLEIKPNIVYSWGTGVPGDFIKKVIEKGG